MTTESIIASSIESPCHHPDCDELTTHVVTRTVNNVAHSLRSCPDHINYIREFLRRHHP